MIHCVTREYQNIIVYTGDTDVLMLTISFRPMAASYDNSVVYTYFMTAGSLRVYDINALSLSIGVTFCSALPFFFAFTGCDTVSSFFNVGKCKFYDALSTFSKIDSLTEVFTTLSQEPASLYEQQIDTIETYLTHVYFPKTYQSYGLNEIRRMEFESKPHDNLRVLPPSRNGLIQHIKRSCYQAGWVWVLSHKEITLPDPRKFRWVCLRHYGKTLTVTSTSTS